MRTGRVKCHEHEHDCPYLAARIEELEIQATCAREHDRNATRAYRDQLSFLVAERDRLEAERDAFVRVFDPVARDVVVAMIRADRLEVKVKALVKALGNDSVNDSQKLHAYPNCTPGEGNKANAARGCRRCRTLLAWKWEKSGK